MRNIRIGKRIIPLWLVAVLLTSTVSTVVLAYYVWKTITIPLEVKEPLGLLQYPSQLDLHPGETEEFNVTIQNSASANYLVVLDFHLDNATYQTSYTTFSNQTYAVLPGTQNLTAWIKVAEDAPIISTSITVIFKRVSAADAGQMSEPTVKAYNFTQSLGTGSIVIESVDFGPATRQENYRQLKAHLFHAKERGSKVVALAFWPSGAPIGEEALREVYGSEFPNVPEYGTSVVYLGYVPGAEVGMQTFGDNTATAKGTDHYGTPIGNLPLMQQCQSAADFDLWAEWASGTPGEQQVIQFVQGRHGGPSAVPLVVGATAAIVPGMTPFYTSGQILGYLGGIVGAVEYEFLLNRDYGYPVSP